jgi:alkylation response protein AidB-like acyl-CoA dehydrogenase
MSEQLSPATERRPADEVGAPHDVAPAAESGRDRRVRVLRSDAEALAAVAEVLPDLAAGAARRDRERRLPYAELDRLGGTGFFGITVPARFGGAGVSVTTLAELFRRLGRADPNIGQIPHSHFVFLQVLLESGTPRQQQRFFAEARAGRRFANAQSERGSRTIAEDRTTLTRHEDGSYRLDGEKFYATGSLFADWLAVRAVLSDPRDPVLGTGAPQDDAGDTGNRRNRGPETGPGDRVAPVKVIAYVRADAPGVTVEDDWDALGQRTTGSGTVRLSDVAVPVDDVVPYSPIFERPTTYGAFAQVLHAALDAGIARAALDATAEAVTRSRPWFESGAERAGDDPLLIQLAGEVEISVRAAEALVREAAGQIDEARAATDAERARSTARASVATAAAKVAAARAAVDAGSALFEIAGTRAALDSLNLSRFWRDARTHTLHDPNRWKVQHLGRWALDGVAPPRHGLL